MGEVVYGGNERALYSAELSFSWTFVMVDLLPKREKCYLSGMIGGSSTFAIFGFGPEEECFNSL